MFCQIAYWYIIKNKSRIPTSYHYTPSTDFLNKTLWNMYSSVVHPSITPFTRKLFPLTPNLPPYCSYWDLIVLKIPQLCQFVMATIKIITYVPIVLRDAIITDFPRLWCRRCASGHRSGRTLCCSHCSRSDLQQHLPTTSLWSTTIASAPIRFVVNSL